MIIIGAKGFAKEVLEVLCQQSSNESEIVFFDNVSKDLPSKLFDKFPILQSEQEVKDYFITVSTDYVLGVGSPLIRFKLASLLSSWGGNLVSTISPFAHVGKYGNTIDRGCNIMTGTTITSDIKIGEGSLINLHCTIGHDSVIEKFVEMSPGVNVSGNCKIGSYCSIGTNAVVLPKVTIGDNVIVGAGSVVTKDIPSNSLVVGVPGKIVKELPPISF